MEILPAVHLAQYDVTDLQGSGIGGFHRAELP
jgi:hypothetical protein